LAIASGAMTKIELAGVTPDAVRFYTKRKTVTQRWPASGDARLASFSFPSGQG